MPSIAIHLGEETIDDPPLDDPEYRLAYARLIRELQDRGIDVRITRRNDSYTGGGTFTEQWIPQRDAFVLHTESWTADLIYNKGGIFPYAGNERIINARDLDRLCRDKWETYSAFPTLCPQTTIVGAEDRMQEALKTIPSDLVVLKPLRSYGGQGVWIGPKGDWRQSGMLFPCIAQEFIDTSAGIPDLTITTHDFRVVFMEDRILLTFIRTPRTGSLISNVMQGGTVMIVPEYKRPTEAIALARTVDSAFVSYPRRFYTVDLARNRDGAWNVIELNPEPGLMSLRELGDAADDYFRDVADFLARCSS